MTATWIRNFVMALTVGITAPAFGNVLFTDQAPPATGTFEWNMFAGSTFTTQHVPDVRNLGIGTGRLNGNVLAPGFAPPPMVVPGVRDLYTGSATTSFTAKIESAATTGALTTFVLQLTVDPEADLVSGSILMNGAAPTELVDRGVGVDELHYYWAEWQTAAAATLSARFNPDRTSQGDHFVLYGAQLDYYNGAELFNAVAGHAIPEPTSLSMAGPGVIGMLLVRRKRVAVLM